MNLTGGVGLFGNPTRTNILLILGLVGESHASELGRLIGTSASNIGKALDALEQAGVIARVAVGRSNRVSLDPRYYAHRELRALLEKLAMADTELLQLLGQVRRRPRQRGRVL